MILNELAAADAPAAPTYAQVMEVTGASRLVFISGQIPVTKDGHIPESFEEQSRLAWANVGSKEAIRGVLQSTYIYEQFTERSIPG